MRITGKTGLVFALPLLALAFVAGQAPASNDARVSVVLENPTSGPISYVLRWGTTGEWSEFVLPARTRRTHSIESIGGPEDQATIRFDWIGDPEDRFDLKIYNLPAGRYYFRWQGRYLDLHRR